jgi:sulfur carrier protein ThiS
MKDDNESFKGMTVNERLLTCGLLPAFDEAVKNHDQSRLAEILRQVDVDEHSIALTIAKQIG